MKDEMNTTILDEALRYLKLGFSVIPIKRGDKKPLIDWKPFQDRLPKEQEIREWWTRWPDANIALVTGAVSGVVVIDIDKGGSMTGFSPTVTSRTGGDGFHLFYKHPGVPVKNSTRELASLTDVRGDGGYVVIPPSIHPSGNTYEWSVSPREGIFAELPANLLEKLKGSEKKINWKELSVAQVLEGERNNTATQYIGKILHDLSPDLWETAGWDGLKSWNQKSCKPPLDEKELREIFNSIAEKEVGSRKKRFERPLHSITKGKALTTCLADVQPEPISWLWPGRIALGKLTIIAGDPGLGKSLITSTLAAHVSKGFPWPVDKSKPPVGDVVLLSAEDDAADTIRPRLDAAEADCERIHVLKAIQDIDNEGTLIQRTFSFKKDIRALEELLTSLPDCRLLVIDPISAYLDGTESHNNSDIRGLLAPLAELAGRFKVAVVSISHLNKNTSNNNSLYRTMGSLAFIAAARAGYIVTKDRDKPDRRLFMPTKNNLAKDTTGLAYSVITSPNGAPVIAWEPEPVAITADEALTAPEANEERTATDEAVDFLQGFVQNGPAKVGDVQKEARQAGVSDKSLRRARERLGIKPRKSGFTGGWVWGLSEDAPSNEDAKPKSEGTLGREGHLGSGNQQKLSDEEWFDSLPE